MDGGTRIEGSTDQGLAYGGSLTVPRQVAPVSNAEEKGPLPLKNPAQLSHHGRNVYRSSEVIEEFHLAKFIFRALEYKFPLEQAYRHSTSSPPDLPATGRLPWTPLRPLVCQRLSAPPNRQLLDVRNVNIRGTTLSEQTLIIQSQTYIQLAREEGWSGVRRDAVAPSTHVVLPHKAVAI